MTPEELHQRLQGRDADRLTLVDVRSLDEYALSHLPGALHWAAGAPSAESGSAAPPLDRDTPLLVYCSLGYRSARAAEALLERGYSDVTHLAGGIFEWANLGFELAAESRSDVRVHPYAGLFAWLLVPEKRARNTPSSAPPG